MRKYMLIAAALGLFGSAMLAGAATLPNGGQLYMDKCYACHGVAGMGTDKGPSLAGLGAHKVLDVMNAYANGTAGDKVNAQMAEACKAMTPDERLYLAYFVGANFIQPWK